MTTGWWAEAYKDMVIVKLHTKGFGVFSVSASSATGSQCVDEIHGVTDENDAIQAYVTVTDGKVQHIISGVPCVAHYAQIVAEQEVKKNPQKMLDFPGIPVDA